ncbi:Decaprenyl diphosphate synthase-like protein [Mycena floridula]|nr:Decaprenyl diphosphate synthase-like protein [Mycena floridula]
MITLLAPLRWLKTKLASRAQRILLKILSAGPIPRHVAFIMDGNRRYARQKRKQVQEGHSEGYVALRRMLEICLRLDVKCVSVYAFAIDNFKRPENEVEALLQLAEAKARRAQYPWVWDLLDEYGVRLNIIGHKEMFPESVRNAMVKAENMTRHNNRSILNVCMAYASRDEITCAVESCVQQHIRSSQPEKLITVEDIDSQMMTSLAGSPPLDILVRSSGVHRLSDFFLWQCCENTQIHFSKTNWPDFGLWDFVPIILNFQRQKWSRL